MVVSDPKVGWIQPTDYSGYKINVWDITNTKNKIYNILNTIKDPYPFNCKSVL